MPFIREREHAHACPRMPTHAHMSLPASAVFLNPLWCRSAECTARGAPLSPWRTDEWHNTAVLPPLPGHVLRRPLDHVPAACAQIHTLVFFRTHTHTHTFSLLLLLFIRLRKQFVFFCFNSACWLCVEF